jgi:hypothetical protein
MNTPMEEKLKLLVDTLSELIDATLYRQIIGSLMYLTNTRPDICFVVNTLSQFLVEPRHVHLVAAKHVMRYFKGTIDYGLSYDGDHDFTLSGYTDADWVGSVSDRKITSGCCFSLGSAMISWQSRKQSSIALSTVEAEYIVACSASCEAIWLQKLLTGLFDLNMKCWQPTHFFFLLEKRCLHLLSSKRQIIVALCFKTFVSFSRQLQFDFDLIFHN